MSIIRATIGVRLLLVAVTLLSVPAAAWAQGIAVPVTPTLAVPMSPTPEIVRTYGVQDSSYLVIPAWAFTGFTAADNALVSANGFGSRFCTAQCIFEAPLVLPAGASLESLSLDGCDDTAAAAAEFLLVAADVAESGNSILGTFTTGGPAAPGCSRFSGPLNPHTIDNTFNTYFVQVKLTGTNVRFQSVRVRYQLQVSPAPATATFNDVPTSHPFFPFVEALVLAGITSGCGGGNYCPDNPVTRGQLAKFLSTALGLHWAP